MTTQQLHLFNGLYLVVLVVVAILTRDGTAHRGCLGRRGSRRDGGAGYHRPR